MSSFAETVNRARQRCNAVLQERVATKRSEGCQVIIEPALCDAAGAVVCAPDGLKLPLRYDLVLKDAAGKFNPENADSVTIGFGEPVFVTWEHKLRIEIHRLCWDYMQFQIFPVRAACDWESLRNWFLKWFDPNDKSFARPDGLFGVVHFLSDPEVDAGNASLFVDLGSAPVEALGELFDAFILIGVDHCIIGKQKNV